MLQQSHHATWCLTCNCVRAVSCPKYEALMLGEPEPQVMCACWQLHSQVTLPVCIAAAVQGRVKEDRAICCRTT